ncbi:hypothetical protein UFOVP1279_9 [uncultured Caudovirales phage]|uniref:Uncharacterized protein n=1 Tax=uncultured Caudovirales phage TaxID=2100421 RepID=A0A6J5RL65_9CAUD|nr:hypothetical protein UFOVP1279_9 [uncultured Caudovirales phage]
MGVKPNRQRRIELSDEMNAAMERQNILPGSIVPKPGKNLTRKKLDAMDVTLKPERKGSKPKRKDQGKIGPGGLGRAGSTAFDRAVSLDTADRKAAGAAKRKKNAALAKRRAQAAARNAAKNAGNQKG